jgi:hypothetical protein
MSLCLLIYWVAIYGEIKSLTQEPSNQIIAYHVESTTLDDGDYELVPKNEQGFSKDPANVAETITEAPNLSSEVSDTTDPSPDQEGKPRCTIQYFNLLQFYTYILYLALSLGVEMEP